MEQKAEINAVNGVLVWHGDGVQILAQSWGKDGLRIRIRRDGMEQTSDWALDIPQAAEGVIEIGDSSATLTNGNISVAISDIYTQKGYLTFSSTASGESREILREYDWRVWAHNPGSHSLDPVEDGLCRASICFEAPADEKLFGMGQNASDHLNLRGRVIDLYQRHVKAVVPFVVSSRGYGFLWNNPALGRAEFTQDMTRWVADACKQIDFYITVGDSYAAIMSNYADVTGHAPEFPYWASGFWQCKLRYESQDELLGIVREFKRRQLPLSVIVIDFWHWKKLGDWKLDPTFWPDPAAMVEECRKNGVRIMISPWTLIAEGSDNYEAMKEKGLFTGWNSAEEEYINFGDLNPKQYDPTNPEAAAYLWEQWKKNYVDLGIATFWLDACDDMHEIADYGKAVYKIGPAKECHSIYVTAHQKNVYEGLRSVGEDVVTICRNAWAGSQRWGACPAPHDILSSFDHMRQYLIAGLNMMMSGIVWWNCDVGGFITLENDTPEFYELMIRWYQWGVFMPVFRTHGCRPNNEPWTVGGDTYEYLSDSLFLRERLRPYIMEQMQLASRDGLPPMRPCFFDFPQDERCYDIQDAFLFGQDFLVAPVLYYGMRQRDVYLPAGTDWTDVWTGKTFSGGTVVTADAPLSRIPVFVRKGSEELCKFFDRKEA